MSRIREFGHRVTVGFSYGLGFSIALAAVILVTTKWMTQDSLLDRGTDISMLEHHRAADGSSIVGTLKNSSTKNVSIVMIQADLRDLKGQMVDQCMGHIASVLEAGAERGFRVACPKGASAGFATYSLHVSAR